MDNNKSLHGLKKQMHISFFCAGDSKIFVGAFWLFKNQYTKHKNTKHKNTNRLEKKIHCNT